MQIQAAVLKNMFKSVFHYYEAMRSVGSISGIEVFADANRNQFLIVQRGRVQDEWIWVKNPNFNVMQASGKPDTRDCLWSLDAQNIPVEEDDDAEIGNEALSNA